MPAPDRAALQALALATTARARAREDYERRDAEWRAAIVAALERATQQQVAEVAGITQGRVAQILQGRR